MNLKADFKKFSVYMQSGGLKYALWRGMKYFEFLAKRALERKRPRQKESPITRGKLKIEVSGCGVDIAWNGVRVTGGCGLNFAVNTLGVWTDSVKARWSVLERTPHSYKCRLFFKELPMVQIWDIRIEDEQTISWAIDMQPSEWLNINEFRIVCFVNPSYKTWIVNDGQADFYRLDDYWHDVYLGNETAYLVGARFPTGGIILPSFILDNGEEDLLPLIQNPPLDNASHIVGLRKASREGKNSYPAGSHRIFRGKIKLYDNDRLLDGKIEGIRLDSLERAISKKSKEPRRKHSLKILLANLPWQKDGKWGVRAGSRWPHIKDESEGDYLPFPFFLAYATSLLRKYDIEANLIDAVALEMPEDEFLEKIENMNFDYLVTETSIPSYYYDLDLLKKISQKGIPIILCGPNSEIYQADFLDQHPFINFVLYAEYEFTLLELVQALQEEKNLHDVGGLIYRDNGRARKNFPREPFDIDLLPWPCRDGLPMHKYLDAPGEMRTPSVQIMASRGCPFTCQFCLWPQVIYQGHHYRARRVSDVVDEMECMVREMGFKSVYFDDDTFNIGKARMLEFCQELIKRGLADTQWAIMARPDLMDEEILEKMKKAGLWAVKYGVESVDQNLVDNIGKCMDLKKAEQMIKYTQKLGIKTHLTFTFGLPGETKETIEKTIESIKRLNPFSVQFSITTPFPGTAYYDILDKNGLIVSKDFSSYDGHYKSVIKLENLAPSDLENAREKAYRVWAEHSRKKRGFLGNLRKFYRHLEHKGLSYAIARGANYFKKTVINNYFPLRDSEKREAVEKSYANKDTQSSHEGIEQVDILLIQSPPWDIEMPPLGVAYLSGFLRKHGYKTAIFDLNVSLYNSAGREIKYLWEQQSYDHWVESIPFQSTWSKLKETTIAAITKKLKAVDVKYIGLSVSFASIRFANEVIAIIKNLRPDVKIILGGWGCINGHMRGLFRQELIECFVVAEGEETLLEVLENFKNNGENIKTIPGAILPKIQNYVYQPRHPIMDLDSIPWPKFSEFNLSQYSHSVLPLFGSRGCIGSCSFCNDWPSSKPYRFRSAKSIFEEIKYHVGFNHVNIFSFKDLLCNGNINELTLLCDLIIKSGIKIEWDSQAIPRKEMTYELLTKLEKSGCSTLIYGIESFSNGVLKKMKKLFTKEIAEKVLRETHRAGINSFFNIIVGFPGETEEDFQETLEAIKRNRKLITQIGAVSVCLANGSADLEIHPEAYGIVIPDDPATRAKQWHSKDGTNTYDIRKERAKRVLDLIEKLGFDYATRTI